MKYFQMQIISSEYSRKADLNNIVKFLHLHYYLVLHDLSEKQAENY